MMSARTAYPSTSMPLSSGSIGSHRAFMGVCATLCICLLLTLYVGWNWYFESLAGRRVLITLSKKAEERAQGLENLGLKADTGEPSPALRPDTPPAPTGNEEPSPAAPTVATNLPQDVIIKEMPPLQDTSEDMTQATALLERYWKAETWQEKVPLVAHSSRVSALMQDFYETQKGADPTPGGLINKARYQIDGIEILYFSYTSSRPNGALEVAMLRGPDGNFLIDWESLVGYGEMSFRDFREKRPATPVKMRVYVRLFDYFNFEFSDQTKFLCLKLSAENGESSIYAYCERGSKLARWLETDLSGTGPTRYKGYTLEVFFPPEAQSNQCVHLVKLINPRWLSLR